MQPATLGRYRILGVLGRGGMGVVYEAHDPQIDRVVAIKTIVLDAMSDAEKAVFETRFRFETRSTGRLQHQHIAALYDAGRDGGTAFIVMERVTGSDLKRRLAAGQEFSQAQAVDIAVQLLAALEFAHRHEVIHRDVKPANVMLRDDGVVKLCDFGVARLAESDATRTQGMVLGSLRYASPEQIQGHEVDARTDIFSAGVLLFELLTRELPFKGASDVAVLHRIATESAPSMLSIQPGIAPNIDAAVQRALAKDPAQRFASAAEFARALGATGAGHGDTRPAPPLSAPTAGGTAGLRPHLAAPLQAAAAAAEATSARPVASSKRVWLAAAALGAALLAAAAWFKLPAKPAAVPRPLATAASAASAALVSATHFSASAPAYASALAAASAAPAAVVTALAASAASAPAEGLVAAAGPPASGTAPPLAGALSAAAKAPDHALVPAAQARPAGAAKAAVSTPAIAPAWPADGPWHGRLQCGPRLVNAGGPGAEPFAAELSVQARGPLVSWTRINSLVTETMVGSIDAQGRFKAEGQGSRQDRGDHWRAQATGTYVAKTQRLEGRVQYIRPKDNQVTRECTLLAQRGAAPAMAAQAAPPTAAAKAASVAAAATAGAAATTPAALAKPATQPGAVGLPQGSWKGQLACAASLSKNSARPDADPFKADIAIEVSGTRISLTRQRSNYLETTQGNFDAKGHFSAVGQGAYKDGRSGWLVRAWGEWLPGQQHITGQVQLLRTSDKAVARECTLKAQRP